MDIPPMPFINIDSDKINQAFLNLYLNAIEAMPDGGTLAIEAAREKTSGMLRITVKDTGKGIDKKELARVFDPYFTTKDAGYGTGLGLSQVYGFARQNGGTVSIETAPGRGTSVSLRLPRALNGETEAA